MRGKLRFILFDAMSLISDNFGTHRRLAVILADSISSMICSTAASQMRMRLACSSSNAKGSVRLK
jgi:hypothetical protein